MSVLGAVNRPLLNNYTTPEDWLTGFFSRFLIIYAHAERSWSMDTPPAPPEMTDWFAGTLRRARAIPEEMWGKCVGVHPVGSLVRLKSGKLGIVSQAGKTDLLSPVVMTFYSTNSGHYNEIKRLDLSKTDDEVVSGVRPDDFGINLPKFFREVFIHQVP